MGLRQGVKHIEASAERAKQRRNSGVGTTNWFYWSDGQTRIVRFLTDADEVFVVFVHSGVETKDGKKKQLVCRRDFHDCDGNKPGIENGKEVPPKGCEHKDFCEVCAKGIYRREMGFGTAVLREEVMGEEDGVKKVTGYKDYTYEIDEVGPDGKKTGKKKIAPWVGILYQAPTNFWSFINAVYAKYGSLKKFDMEIKRIGGDAKTQYMPFPLPPMEIENIDKRYEKYVPNLRGYLERIGSQAYYDKVLRGVTTKAAEPDASEGVDEAEAGAADLGDDDTEFDRLKKLAQEGQAAQPATAESYS